MAAARCWHGSHRARRCRLDAGVWTPGVRCYILHGVRRSTTRLSSKGQVVIPAWAREALKLRTGDELVVTLEAGNDRSLLLRAPAGEHVERLLEEGCKWYVK